MTLKFNKEKYRLFMWGEVNWIQAKAGLEKLSFKLFTDPEGSLSRRN